MKAILYNNGGCGNHGCEAIVRMLAKVLQENGFNYTVLMTLNEKEEYYYGLQEVLTICNAKTEVSKKNLRFILAYMANKFFKKYIYLDMLAYRKNISTFHKGDIAFAIGGDTYCYGHSDSNTYMHELYCKKGVKTILWECSIEPDALKDKKLLKDIKAFDFITARESITYNSLKANKINNVELIPDLAFALPKKKCLESDKIIPKKTVGLNVSPLVLNYQKYEGAVLDNCVHLIEYILKESDYVVALIPHVVWEQSNDEVILNKIYKMFEKTKRVILLGDHNCMELKDIISRCRFFIGARTHATIAAYSSCVPTLTLGYSVKSRGIARDIFGTEENYVLPVQKMNDRNDLKKAFQWFQENEETVREHLKKTMPEYIKKVQYADQVIKRLL